MLMFMTIISGAECPACPGKYDDPGFAVRVGFVECASDLAYQGTVHRVELPRAIQQNSAYAVVSQAAYHSFILKFFHS